VVEEVALPQLPVSEMVDKRHPIVRGSLGGFVAVAVSAVVVAVAVEALGVAAADVVVAAVVVAAVAAAAVAAAAVAEQNWIELAVKAFLGCCR
jgi:hypothetical protein